MKYDTTEIKNANPLLDVISRDISLKQNGREYQACCPFHSEKTPSFSVVPDKEFAYCFGCGENIGDAIDWTMKYHGVDFATACEILGGAKEAPGHKGAVRRSSKIEKDAYAGIEPIIPIPSHVRPLTAGKKTPKIFNPKRAEDPDKAYSTLMPSMVFKYGQHGYVLRVDIGKAKITPTVMWCKIPDGSEQWCYFSLPEPRPLYIRGSDKADAPVLIVEGEKAADAASRMLPHAAVVTWSGGTNGMSKADWSFLKGRKCLAWPDADEPGLDVMTHLMGKALDLGCSEFKIIDWDKSKPKGWDAADAEAEGWNHAMINKWAAARIVKQPELKSPEGDEDEHYARSLVDSEPPAPEPEPDEAPRKSASKGKSDDPYRCLGFRDGVYYYLPRKTQQIMKLTPGQHNKQHLVILAPTEYWAERFPGKTKDGVDWDCAYEALINRNIKEGVFDGHDKIRGRGAWMDEGRSILHLGHKVIVDGKDEDPKELKSRYIYEADTELAIPEADRPATNKEAYELMDICNSLNWEQGLYGPLLAGWCVIAPLCGVLKWRPHIWVTGAAGAGKTTVMKSIIERVVGPIGFYIEGKTSEAGIRQHLRQDARPVVIDEAEGEDKHGAQRIQDIIDLARVASSGGRILKGSAGGVGMSFSVRSCFCFSSINTSLKHHADESRISKIIIKKDTRKDAKERFKALNERMFTTFTPEYSAKLLKRSLKNLDLIQKNIEVFTEAATAVFNSRRIGDQIGAMLAGAHLCHKTKEISYEDAISWICKHDWTEYTSVEAKTDDQKLIDKIATHRVRVTTHRGPQDTTVGEMIIISSSGQSEGEITPEVAAKELSRFGIKTIEDDVLIANKSDPMKRVLYDTPWQSDWGRPLKDIPGAGSVTVTYFCPGIKSRATRIPIETFSE